MYSFWRFTFSYQGSCSYLFMFIFFKEGNSEKFVNWRKGILPSASFVMILAWNSLWKGLSWLSSLPVSSHFYAPLRPCNLVPRDLPPQGQIEEKRRNEVARSQWMPFTGLHYRNRVTLKIAYLLTSMSLHDYASVLRDLITLFSVYTSWQTGRFRMWVNGKKISGLDNSERERIAFTICTIIFIYRKLDAKVWILVVRKVYVCKFMC